MILFPHVWITYPNGVREPVRAHQPDRGTPPAAEDVHVVLPPDTGPAGDLPILPLTPIEPPAPAEANGREVGPGSPPAHS